MKVVPFRTLSTMVRTRGVRSVRRVKKRMRASFFPRLARELSRSIAQTRSSARFAVAPIARLLLIAVEAPKDDLLFSPVPFVHPDIPLSDHDHEPFNIIVRSFHNRFIKHVNGERGQFTLQLNDGSLYNPPPLREIVRSLKRFILFLFLFLHLTCKDMLNFFDRNVVFSY